MILYAWRAFSAPWQPEERRPAPVPPGVWVWVMGMFGMLLALWVAHAVEQLGTGQTIKSTIGWVKGWALLAAFPLVGACLAIRPELLIRAMGWFALQTLILIPILVAAALVRLPSKLFVSPLQAVGGPGPEFFSVYLYTIDPSNGALRWQFIAPWAPAAGMIGCLMFVMAVFERDRFFRWVGIATAILICLMTKSRMALLFVIMFPPALWIASRLTRSSVLLGFSVLSALFGVAANAVIVAVQDAIAAFRGARADSTRVREALGRIATGRWRDEAPLWGHGIVERGPHYVEFMPIGSHHTWFGLLFVKGLVGFISLAVPLLWTFVEMLLLAQISALGRMGLAVAFILFFFSFGENLEILAYLFWPGLVLLGAAFTEAHRLAAPAVEAMAAE
ncbi:O-antigen ligase domain-containing protein [Rhodovarius crocodyli]|uniref:O-antigen ligase domain-containing protein n=1 Tax=Rhodovarius crocodyli TaxID=1979269 RepID=UPI0013E3664B|nr:O-antigen ligase domain-containing protein [Rhodovarius crocodyli]